MADTIAPGEVWLVGAGPGDPDLLTRKAERLIGAASVIFYDALVGPGVLELIPSHVRRVAVGKRSGRHSKDQTSINDLLLAAAQDGERVVRLKGGDPSVFGRSAEEAAHLRAAGVRVQICPGITAASAAAANAGVSLTLRGLARRLQLVTAHARAGEPLDLDWAAVADPSATLAIYMGRASAKDVARNLQANGVPGTTPVLIAANVSLPDEQLLFTRLDLLPLAIRSIGGDGPALLLVGEAMRADASAPARASRPLREAPPPAPPSPQPEHLARGGATGRAAGPPADPI
jgi:uroporphyrin-III C-methyltransferase